MRRTLMEAMEDSRGFHSSLGQEWAPDAIQILHVTYLGEDYDYCGIKNKFA